MTRYITPRALTPEQEAVVIERRQLWRVCTLKAIAAEMGVSISTVRRIEREARLRGQFLSFPRSKL